jgi:hypothetical protein
MTGTVDTRRLTQTQLLAVTGGGAGLAALGSLDHPGLSGDSGC